jgi:hypothetical protein
MADPGWVSSQGIWREASNHAVEALRAWQMHSRMIGGFD